MLQELTIRNFAIIDDIQIRFRDGLTILSGETARTEALMFESLRSRLLVKLFINGFKHLEKTDWMTQTLTLAFKSKVMQNFKTWNGFLDAVNGLMDDAKDEIKNARDWVDASD